MLAGVDKSGKFKYYTDQYGKRRFPMLSTDLKKKVILKFRIKYLTFIV